MRWVAGTLYYYLTKKNIRILTPIGLKLNAGVAAKQVSKMEDWKVIQGHPKYAVSNLGRVKKGGLLLKPQPHTSGYLQVRLYSDRIQTRTIHSLVAQEFIPNSEGKPTINHIDRDKTNNMVDNLEWATQSEQMLHSPKAVGSSGERHIQKRKHDFVVKITRNKVFHYVGTFKTLAEAITARDERLIALIR